MIRRPTVLATLLLGQIEADDQDAGADPPDDRVVGIAYDPDNEDGFARWVRFVLSPEDAQTFWSWSGENADGYRKMAPQFDDAEDEVALAAVLEKTRAILVDTGISAREHAATPRARQTGGLSDPFKNWLTDQARPHVIVLGNEKGGSGKSTTAMHLAVGLLRAGYSVGSIDLDTRQGTLTHYMRNRERYSATTGLELVSAEHRRIRIPAHMAAGDARHDERLQFASAIEDLRDKNYIVIDTPGNNTFLSRLAHILADTLVTPLNDSFLDIDVLARMDLDAETILGPSIYSRSVMDRWPRRRALGGEPLNWVVMRNRLAHLDSHNQKRMAMLLASLAPRIGFRMAPGLSERVVFRELFTKGMTVLDLPEPITGSHAAARAEAMRLLDSIGVPAGVANAAQ